MLRSSVERQKRKAEAFAQRLAEAGASAELPQRHGKYKNVRTTYNGETFDSLGEAEYARKLDLKLATGEIMAWWRPPPITLIDADRPRDRITYRPDFAILPTLPPEGGTYYVDYKGSKITETQAFRIKVKLWARSQSAELRVAYRNGEEKVVSPARKRV